MRASFSVLEALSLGVRNAFSRCCPNSIPRLNDPPLKATKATNLAFVAFFDCPVPLCICHSRVFRRHRRLFKCLCRMLKRRCRVSKRRPSPLRDALSHVGDPPSHLREPSFHL